MQKLMKERLRELKVRQRRRRQMGIIAAFFGVLVIGGVVWSMTRPGVAMTGDATCGIEEHKHSDKCYENVLVCDEKESEGHKHDDSCYKTEEVLVCDKEETEANSEEGIEGHTHDKGCYEEKKELVCKEEESKGHTHTDKCYKKELVCGKEEHTHEEDCYIDRSADVEKKSDWDKQYKSTKWKDAWGEDLVTAAEKQVGYKESTKNYKKVNGDQKGYTRYGEFSGEPYADWDAAFVNFCIHYAGISKSDVFPNTTDTNKWYNKFSKVNGSFLTAPEGYEPEKGDIVFFEKKKGETDFTVGIVSSFDKDKKEIKVIEGNVDNEVKEEKYGTGDSQIFAYIKVTELEQAFKGMQPDDAENKEEEPAETEEPTESEETEGDETEESSPAFDSEYEGDGVIIHVKADAGVVPEGAELSVTPIEKKKITSDMSAEEKEEAEKVNEQYDMTNEKLNEESEKNEQELQGFLAYDISFMLDGQEIEPNGEVKVTMDFKEAVVPEGVSENAQVAINHLKENGNGGVKVENLTEASTTNITTAEKDAAVEKVELVADNFSVFTIVWKAPIFGTWGELPVKYVDDKSGREIIPEDPEIAGEVEFDIKSASGDDEYDLEKVVGIGERWSSITNKNDGVFYAPIKMRINGKDVVKAQVLDGSWIFKNSSNVPVFQVGIGELQEYCLEIVCAPANIQIVNNVEQTGNLDVELSESVSNTINVAKLNGKKIQYIWSKSINGEAYQELDNIEYDNMSSITGVYGESLNVALDDGILDDNRQSIVYKVELWIGEEGAENREKVAESMPKAVSYYGELRNGGFDDDDYNISAGAYDQIHEKDVTGWKTTASDQLIEIAKVAKVEGEAGGGIDGYYIANADVTLPPDFWAVNGDQFAELNAKQVGSLYQDVLAVKGVPLRYAFSHMSRPNTCPDSMYLIIAPTWVAKRGVPGGKGEIDTQEEVETLIREVKDNPEEYPNVIWRKVTSTAEGSYVNWKPYDGVYNPEYNLIRFYFVSDKESTYASMGNFIDDVSFGQSLPKPKPKTFNFSIKKTVTGLNETQFEKLKAKLTFKVSVKDGDTAITINDSAGNKIIGDGDEIKAEDLTWFDNNGVYTGVYDEYKNVPINGSTYKITVEETEQGMEAFECEPMVATIMDSGKDGTFEKGSKKEVNVSNKSNTGVHLRNVYKVKDDSTWEVVKRSLSNKEKPLHGATFVLTEPLSGSGAVTTTLSTQQTNVSESGAEMLDRVATGTSDEEGKIAWKKPDGSDLDVKTLNGDYVLRETQAPEGYKNSEKQWNLHFDNGKLDVDTLGNQIATAKEEAEAQGKEILIDLVPEGKNYKITIYNVRLYSLPSTGGKGIYLYMFSGILLMAGGLLMTYKNRRRGVLGS